MKLAQDLQETTVKKSGYSRLGLTDNRWQEAIYWQTRALSFYQVAALLPVED